MLIADPHGNPWAPLLNSVLGSSIFHQVQKTPARGSQKCGSRTPVEIIGMDVHDIASAAQVACSILTTFTIPPRNNHARSLLHFVLRSSLLNKFLAGNLAAPHGNRARSLLQFVLRSSLLGQIWAGTGLGGPKRAWRHPVEIVHAHYYNLY